MSTQALAMRLCRCTNDKFKSMRHRVISNGQDRYSVAFFVNADHDATLTCLPVSLASKIALQSRGSINMAGT